MDACFDLTNLISEVQRELKFLNKEVSNAKEDCNSIVEIHNQIQSNQIKHIRREITYLADLNKKSKAV